MLVATVYRSAPRPFGAGVSDAVEGFEVNLEELIVEDAPLLETLIPWPPTYGLVIQVIHNHTEDIGLST